MFVLCVMLVVRNASAEPRGGASLVAGIRAFEKHDYAEAAKQFQAALAKGGLSRAQTLTAYIDLGTTLVALGRTNLAQRAFEEAALIDPRFVVPPHSGRQATSLANQARRKQETLGQYHLDAGVPGEVPPHSPFRVTVELDPEQAALGLMVRVFAQEPDSGKQFETVEPSAPRIDVDIPGDLVTAGVTLALRFELLDAHENRVATLDKSVQVSGVATPGRPGDKTADRTPDKNPGDKTSIDKTPDKTGSDTSGAASAGSDEASATATTNPHETKKPASGDDGDDSGDDASADTGGPWSIPHGSKQYTAARTDKPPKIDGLLDDAIWQTAPKDDRFLSTKSKPYGKPTTEPTVVQIAYDEKNLYVAFTCRYSKPREHQDAYASDEQTLLDESEYVAVVVDPLHAHTGGYEFAVSPAGVRADAEISEQGSAQNLDWHGIWDAATSFTADGWTAELAIPWGTMHMPSNDGTFDVGIELQRREPLSGEMSLWTLHPPATENYDVNYFGHLEGLSRVHPGQRLLLIPYLALAFDGTPLANQPFLTDFAGTDTYTRAYAGLYLRLRPPGPFRLDATFNPDFSSVTPDASTANLDRFELEYPENRQFFAEDNPRFAFGGARYEFGDLGAQLFYSRRLGIVTDAQGFTDIVPILYGVKSVVHDGGTEGAIMNVETIQPNKSNAFDDNATVARVSETIDGQRIGAIGLLCEQCGSNATGSATGYESGGLDTQLAFYERHLQLSGFVAGSSVAGTTSGAGEGTAAWKSQDVYAKATLLEVGQGFQAPLGFFETTGVRDETIAAGYTPVVRSDHVQQFMLDAQLSIVRNIDSDALVYQRAVVAGGLETIDGAQVQVAVQPSTENVTTAFPLGNGRITIPVGEYKVLATQFALTSPPNRTFVFGLRYLGGDLYDGTRNAPGATVGVNLGRFTARASYLLYMLKFPERTPPINYYGYDIMVNANYAYSPLARTSLVLEADTVAARAAALLTTSVQFNSLSAIVLSIRGQSGATFDMPMLDTYSQANFSAILSLQLGVSPI